MFLDSDNLSDLRNLLQHVMQTKVLVLLQTKSVLTRPWVIMELYTAVTHDVPIVALNVMNANRYDYAAASEFLLHFDEDIDIDEILEAVRVDFEPQKSGWAGTPESIMKEYEAMLLAREQDSKVKEENEELRKTVAALTKENKTLTSAAQKLKAQNEKFTTTLETLQEKLETSNVSNAKLLYINRALENASLNERQKEKIVEAIAKAESPKEAKRLHETLTTTVGSKDKKGPKSLSESVNRKSNLSGMLNRRQNLNESQTSDPLFNKMKKFI